LNARRLQLGLVAFVVFVAWFAFLQWKKRRKKLKLLQSPILFYQQMLAQLQKRGLMKPVSLTPREFARQVTNALPDAGQDVGNITDLFYKARFGNYRLNQEDCKMIELALARLEEIS
jgi:uncharacterized protein DUF4129